MRNKKADGAKVIANAYRILRPLFQVRNYLYAQVCCLKSNYEIVTAALYVYENQDPSQSLKMLSEKLQISDHNQYSNLIFPLNHIKDTLNDKNISMFFIEDYIVPLRYYERQNFTIPQFFQILHGAVLQFLKQLSCLNQLHIRDIVHGNISMNTCYLVRQKDQKNCKFALNILDTQYFTEDDSHEGIEDRLYESEGQALGLKVSYKDDLQSLVYVMTHLLSKGRLFTTQRFQLQWVTESEFLRWKTCDYFKEIIKIVPPQLQILIEIYTIAKSMHRTEKPDYLKLMKKVLNIMSANCQHKQSEQKNEEIYVPIRRYKGGQQNSNQSSINQQQIQIKLKPSQKMQHTRFANDF